jgi:hypothetical protein
MTARQIRRAAERKARKLARKESTARTAETDSAFGAHVPFAPAVEVIGQTASDASSPCLEEHIAPQAKTASHARLVANRQNAQLSTGPRTVEGKATSALNALRTGLTGRTVVLPSEDAAVYQAHVQRFVARYSPQTDEEKTLTQQLADTEWRLLRVPALEMGIYAVGRLELASNFQNEADPDARAALLDAQIFLTYQRQLNNLSIQEGRLLRLRDKTQAALEGLLRLRLAPQEVACNRAATADHAARNGNAPLHTGELGFEFPSAPIIQIAAPERGPDQSITGLRA